MRIRTPVLVVISAMLATSGCGSDGSAEPETELAVGTIVGTIDGTPWTTTTAFALNVNGRIVATGTGTGNLTFGFGVTAQAPGTFTVGASGSPTGILADAGNTVWEAVAAGGSGSLTITSIVGNEVAGTFSFTMSRTSGSGSPATRSIADGRFRVRY